jgi:hypothetical protein
MANFIQQSLQLNDVTGDGAFWVVSPFESGILASYLQNNGDVYKDFAIKNGYVGSPFAGLDIYVSNNLTHSATLGMATQPTAGDTVTINGVVFTFVASIGSTAGNVLIGANVDVTRASLVAAVNGAAGAGTTYVEVGNDLYGNSNRLKLQRAQITATNDNTADTMAVTTLGTLVVSKSLTAGGDVWTSVTRHSIAGIKGSITLAIPSDGMEFKNIEVSGKHGREIETSQIYNGTIWSQLRPQVFDVVIKS